MRLLSLFAFLTLPALAFAQKDTAIKSASAHSDANWGTALKIWEWAEPGYQEKKSAEALAAIAEKAGFKVTKGVAKIPTAFTAESSASSTITLPTQTTRSYDVGKPSAASVSGVRSSRRELTTNGRTPTIIERSAMPAERFDERTAA